jgi:hypothetical protein
MMLSVLEMYFQEIKKKKVTDADEDGGDSDATITRINLRTSALLLLLEHILSDKSTDPVGAIEGLLKLIRVSHNAKQQARLALVSGNNHVEEQEFENASHPFLPCHILVSQSQSV